MALSFLAKAKQAAAKTDTPPAGVLVQNAAKAAEKPATSAVTQAKASTALSSGGMSFLKTGAAARKLVQEDEARAAARKEQQGKSRRFWMKNGTSRRITFLDGEVDADGFLDIPMMTEHELTIAGERTQFVCTADADKSQPCPICARDDAKTYLIGFLTVIDHSEYVVQKGKNAGEKRKNQRYLFAAKKETLQLLTKYANKRDGLTGCTFEVSRSGEMSAGVGSIFDFEMKRTLAQVTAQEGVDPEVMAPLNYGEEIVFKTAQELIDAGIGKAMAKGPGSTKTSAALANEL